MVIALIVFLGLIIFRFLTAQALEALQDKIDVSIYFKADAPEDEILKAKKALESLAEVKRVEYISRDRALEIFKERHVDNEAISQSLEELDLNPLLASLNIKAYHTEQYEAINRNLENAPFKNFFEKITYAKNALVIERLGKIIDVTEKGGFAVIAFLAVVAALVTFNTIRLAIYASREEIGIMRLVGASNFLIRGPYMVEGIIYGVIAAALSMLLVSPVIYLASPVIRKVFEFRLWEYFVSNALLLFFYQLLFGVGLGIVSSFIAVRKYLRM